MISDVSINMGQDYPLSGTLTYFEAYMFATTQKHIDKFEEFCGDIVIANGDNKPMIFSMENINERKTALSSFNKLAKERNLSFPKPDSFSCVVVDLFAENDNASDEDFFKIFDLYKTALVDWCISNDRIGVVVEHLYQEERCPHIHLLYQRAPRKHNEFQNYFAERYLRG